MAVMLSTEGIIALDRLSAFFSEMTQGAIHPSDATINSFLKQFAEKLPDELKAIEEDLLDGKVMCVDETPLDGTQVPVYDKNHPEDAPTLVTAEKTTFNIYLRTHSNDQSTLYTVNPQKDSAGVIRDDILPKYAGTINSDYDIKYMRYGTNHSLCTGHVTRELKGMHELEQCDWAKTMRQFFQKMIHHKNIDLENGRTACDKDTLCMFENEYDILVKEGQRVLEDMRLKDETFGYANLRRMTNRLEKRKDYYLLFMRNYDVPATNNLAERDLRSSKTFQKVSGCFRSWLGAKTYSMNMSFVSTVKKRGLNLLESISSIFKGNPVLARPSPSLSQDELLCESPQTVLNNFSPSLSA
jgi:hypothetical protein